MTAHIELLAEGNHPTSGYTTIEWVTPRHREARHLDTRTGPWLEMLGHPSATAVGLARTAVAVFTADRLVRRKPLRQTRDIDLLVSVPDPGPLDAAIPELELLLGWLTGDDWHLAFAADRSARPPNGVAHAPVREVSLLSGGLDSFCGALIGGVEDRLFLSHSDSPVIKRSQVDATGWLREHRLDPKIVDIRLAPPAHRGREPSRRSRSFLFMGLAIALADAVGATTVEVPENGFTSLNVPLAANRGGVFTTRSTHPRTFDHLSRILVQLGLPLKLANPYEFMTKGELISAAAAAVGSELVTDGLTHTLSCAKANPILHGSGFGINCGLDYSCLVRRGGVTASALEDRTRYLVNTLDSVPRSQLVNQRRADIAAVRLAVARGASLEQLLAAGGGFPDGYDVTRAADLWQRGLQEIAHVPLP